MESEELRSIVTVSVNSRTSVVVALTAALKSEAAKTTGHALCWTMEVKA